MIFKLFRIFFSNRKGETRTTKAKAKMMQPGSPMIHARHLWHPAIEWLKTFITSSHTEDAKVKKLRHIKKRWSKMSIIGALYVCFSPIFETFYCFLSFPMDLLMRGNATAGCRYIMRSELCFVADLCSTC